MSKKKSLTDKEAEGVVEKEAVIGTMCHSLSSLSSSLTHPANQLCVFHHPVCASCLSLFNNSLQAPCWIWLRAEVVSVTALQTHWAWFGSSVCHSVRETVSGCELMGLFLDKLGTEWVCPYGQKLHMFTLKYITAWAWEWCVYHFVIWFYFLTI